MNLEYGMIWPNTKVLGPGNRFVIWTQGCQRRCFRCTSPELQPFGQGSNIDTANLARQIIESHNIDGITISGGEPLLQASALIDLLYKVRQKRPDLTVLLFTGYKLKQIKVEFFGNILEYIDVLVDGKYIDELNDNRGLRGSSNQTIHFLTSRLEEYRDILENGVRKREIHVLNDNKILTIGIADKYVNHG